MGAPLYLLNCDLDLDFVLCSSPSAFPTRASLGSTERRLAQNGSFRSKRARLKRTRHERGCEKMTSSAERSKKWRERNRQQVQSYEQGRRRDLVLQNAYNISLGEWNELFSEQGGKCALCSVHQSQTKHGLVVDYSRKEKRVRGLLCKPCNEKIKRLNSKLDFTIRCLKYLGKFPA